VLDPCGPIMAGGGDAPSVPIWDMAVLAGATLMISTVVIIVWTQPVTYSLDGPEEVLTIHSGLSTATLSFESACLDDPCNELSVWIVPHDGKESWDGSMVGADEVILLDSESTESSIDFDNQPLTGEYRIILDGEGSYTFETSVNRTIPHQFVPSIIGALFVVWGIWRKQQEEMD